MTISRLEINVNSTDMRITSATSKGNQSKWFKDNIWIKANELGYEDIAEWVSSVVLRCSSLPRETFVEYGLATIHHNGETKLGSYSRNFIPRGVTLVTFYKIMENKGEDLTYFSTNRTVDYRINKTIELAYKHTGLDITDYLRALVTLDAFILNEDRHLNNIAFLFNGTHFRIAPIFDNGLSLLSDVQAYRHSVPLVTNIRKVKARPFSKSFDKQLKSLGVGLKINEEMLRVFMEEHRQILGRAYKVLDYQINRYKGEIVV